MEENLSSYKSCQNIFKFNVESDKTSKHGLRTPSRKVSELYLPHLDQALRQEIKSKENASNQSRKRKRNVLLPIQSAETYENNEGYKQRRKEFQIPSVEPENNQKLHVLQNFYNYECSHQINKRYIKGIYLGTQYALKVVGSPSQNQIHNKSRLLFEQVNSHKKFLFLDLDQTLIKTQRKEPSQKKSNLFKVSIRPYTFVFLETISQYFEIYAFTSATKQYANAAIKKINTKCSKPHCYIKDVLSRNDCFQTKKKVYIKDLRIVKNRELKDIVIVDNLVESFALQINNGIPILEFNGQEGDRELMNLVPFLKEISQVEDVRPFIKEKFNLEAVGALRGKEVEGFLALKQVR